MKTIREVLSEADPVRHEPAWTIEGRQRTRHLAINAASRPEPRLSSLIPVAAMLVLLAVLSAIGIFWPPQGTTLVAAIRFEVRLAEEGPGPGLRDVTVALSDRTIYLHPEVIVSNSDIRSAQVVKGDGGHFGVSVVFSAEGATRMRRATESHIGRPLAILLDGDVVAAPTVRSVIGDSAALHANYTRAEAERIVNGIRGL